MNTQSLFKIRSWKPLFVSVMLAVGWLLMAGGVLHAAPPLPGAIFTTDSTCSGVDLNIYADKEDVYLNGGPSYPGAAGLPDDSYYVKVTAPDGTLLGTSVGSGNDTPVHVTDGEFDACYQLWAILIKASNGTGGYDDTPNPGGEYKVWVSRVATFDNDSTKTDNFKVKSGGGGVQEEATLNVLKFYDANADGSKDDDEVYLDGWKVRITDGIDIDRYTPVHVVVEPDDYTVSEYMPVESGWMSTTATSFAVSLSDGDDKTVEFGNLCLGAGGGRTLGFWSNRNGQALFGADDLTLMVGLNLRNADGTDFDPASYAAFRSWLLSATATNMAYMLSAQLAAMELNVLNGFVSASALIYAPGTNSANALGFAKVGKVMNEANGELGLHGLTLSGSPYRDYQEALKRALDKANNNLNFVQSEPCPFTFSE